MADPVMSNARGAGAGGEPGERQDSSAPPPRQRAFFGLLDIVIMASDGNATSTRLDYVGPRRRLLLTLAIVFGGRRRRDGDYEPVHLDGKPCRFSWHGGLAGPGLANLKATGDRSPRVSGSGLPAAEAA